MAAFCLLPVLSGCASLAYYAQSVHGQLGVMAAARPVDEVLADPQTEPLVRAQLARLPELRAFAVSELGLPHSDSYRRYADLGRDAMVWSVVAAPEDALEARQWCYPVLGCTSYRGYFDLDAARAYAAGLQDGGWDVAIEAVPAYSTLGWFDDPLPSTVIKWPLAQIAGLLFHELAHEGLYVAHDSPFNEAYATVVEQEGVRRWLEVHGDADQRRAHATRLQRQGDFLRLLEDTRSRLRALYAAAPERPLLRQRKAAILAGLQADYAAQREQWGGYGGYDRWFARALNNAHFVSVSTYHALVPAFRQLLAENGGDIKALHVASRALGELPHAQRQAALDALVRRRSALSAD